MTFGIITEESRQKAKETKQAKIAWAEENLYTDFGDDETYWRKLASDFSVRLPAWYIPGSETKHIKRLLTKLGADVKEYLEYSGYSTLKKMVAADPKWPAFAQCGLVLEWWSEKHQNEAEKSA